ncbi:putative permease [Neomoorella glycerini]|uniref:Putative permease n=1 Tax=Neomoorella glycerini TaxID=55779 RepID=A0A6I5ZTE7_9FIRM|nr:permease [Moorella glycerini]QGP93312.1 putative permease [Moorella glycerini]
MVCTWHQERAWQKPLTFLFMIPLKILFMLAVIIFLVSLLRSFFPPEKTRAILNRKHKFWGNILAAILGIVTPFCSCSAVPVFIGFVESGVPLGGYFFLFDFIADG